MAAADKALQLQFAMWPTRRGFNLQCDSIACDFEVLESTLTSLMRKG